MNNSKKYSFYEILKTPIWMQHRQSSISFKILHKLTDFSCKYLPRPIRKFVFTLIDLLIPLTLRILSPINQLYLSEYLVIGKEKHSKADLKILFFNNGKLDPYISKTFFFQTPQYKRIGRISLWKIKKECHKFSSEIDAILIKSDIFYSGFFEKQDFTIIPEWISMTLNLEKTIKKMYEDVFSKNARREIEKANRNNYSYKISQDKKKLKSFYYDMYLPYNKQKHRESALISNYHSIRHLFETDYKLMLFQQDNVNVSGWLFLLKNKKFRAKYLGILQEKMHLLKQGLGAASFYFSIQWAKEHNANVIDFGATRPFLNDGSFIYKKKWGTTIQRSEKLVFYQMYALKKCRESKGIITFLQMNPFVSLEKNQLYIKDYSENKK